jgi:hypothetical protein
MVSTEEVVIDLLEDIMAEENTEVILFLLIYIYIFIHLLIIICFNMLLLKGNRYWGRGYKGYPKYYDYGRYNNDCNSCLEDLCARIPNPSELGPSNPCYQYWDDIMNNAMGDDEDDEDYEDGEEDEDGDEEDEEDEEESEIPEIEEMVPF